jgi:hypothetical protein
LTVDLHDRAFMEPATSSPAPRVGVAVFLAIFSNGLAHELAVHLPGSHVPLRTTAGGEVAALQARPAP